MLLVFQLSAASPSLLRAAPRAPGGRLVVCHDVAPPRTLDPCKSWSPRSAIILKQMFRGLTSLSTHGRLEPCLASKIERIGPRETRFELRKGARFHNGDPVTVADVAFSLLRYTAPESLAPSRGLFQNIRAVRRESPTRGVIVTEHPDGLLEHKLSILYIQSEKDLRSRGAAAFGQRPIGTGPFRFAGRQDDGTICLSAFCDYFESGSPRLDHLCFRFLPRKGQIPALLKGKIDLLTNASPTDLYQLYRRMRVRRIRIVKKYCFTRTGAGFNMRSGLFTKRDARRAANLCLRRPDLSRYVLRGNGRLLATWSLPGQRGHEPSLRPYATNPTLARTLLRKFRPAGAPPLRALALEQASTFARFAKACFADAGVVMQIRTMTDAEMLSRVRSEPWDLLFVTSGDPCAHTAFFLWNAYSSSAPFAGKGSKAFDKRFEAAERLADPSRSEEAFRAIDRWIHKEHLSLFGYQKLQAYALKADLAFEPDVSGSPYFHRTYWRRDEGIGKRR